MTSLTAFNACDPADAAALLRPCLDVDRWIDEMVDGRPYRSVDDLFATARGAANPFTGPELEAALSHHPRIGEQARGGSAEADLSRSEQATLTLDSDVQRRLVEGNQSYERRFGRVFLIRAAGRSAGEILDQLQVRLTNDLDTEDGVVADQLRQIGLVRLAGVVDR